MDRCFYASGTESSPLDRTPGQCPSLPHDTARRPHAQQIVAICRVFLWAVLGSNQSPPACRFGAAVRVSSLMFAQTAWLSGVRRAIERLSEPERTSSVAIVATP